MTFSGRKFLLLWMLAVAGGLCQGGVAFAQDRNEATFAEKKVRIATGEWLPYVSAQMEHQGPLAHVITEAFALAGIEVEYGYFPWTRGYQLMQEGDWDATMPYYCSEERMENSYCSDKLVEGELVFFHLKNFPFDWSSVSDLQDIPIGATLGYHYGEAFELAEQAGLIKVRRIAKDETNLQLLVMGRIRLFPQDKEVGYSMIRSLLIPEQQGQLTHHPRPIHSKPLHLLFPKHKERSMRLLKIFNEGLARLRAEGRLDRYLKDMREGRYLRKAYILPPD